MHRFLLCTVCGVDGTTVPTLPGWNDDYPLVTVFESFFQSRLEPSPIGCFSLHHEPWSSWPARSSRLLSFLVLLRRDSLFVDILSSVWPSKWYTGTTLLSCPRCVRLPSMLLFSGLFTRRGFFGILCLVASHLVCHRLLLRRQAPLVLLTVLGDSCRLLHLLASLADRGGITGIRTVFFISWRLRPLRRSKEGARAMST